MEPVARRALRRCRPAAARLPVWPGEDPLLRKLLLRLLTWVLQRLPSAWRETADQAVCAGLVWGQTSPSALSHPPLPGNGGRGGNESTSGDSGRLQGVAVRRPGASALRSVGAASSDCSLASG